MSLGRAALALSAAAAGAALLAGCDDGSTRRAIDRLAAQHAVSDPPALWSIEARDQAGKAAPGKPVTLCADTQIRDGLRSITPNIGGAGCSRIGEPVKTAHGESYTCRSGADDYAVSTEVTGDPSRDFTTASAVKPLTAAGDGYVQTLHFRRLGACPPGWRSGDSTDRTGRRVSSS